MGYTSIDIESSEYVINTKSSVGTFFDVVIDKTLPDPSISYQKVDAWWYEEHPGQLPPIIQKVEYTKYEKHVVYFKPNSGCRIISGIRKHDSIHQISTQKYGTDKPTTEEYNWSGDDSHFDSESLKPVNLLINDPIFDISFDDKVSEYNKSEDKLPKGVVFNVYEYINKTVESTTYFDDGDKDVTSTISVEETLTISVLGEDGYVNLDVFGDKSYDQDVSRWFAYCPGVADHEDDSVKNGLTEENTCIYLKYNEEHALTNMVVFNNEYNKNSSNGYSGKMCVISTLTVDNTNKKLKWKDSVNIEAWMNKKDESKGIDIQKSLTQGTSVSLSEFDSLPHGCNKGNTFKYKIHKDENNDSIKHILCYVDSYFAIYGSKSPLDLRNIGTERWVVKPTQVYSIPLEFQDDHTNCISTIELANFFYKYNGVNTYPTFEKYYTSNSQDDNTKYVSNPIGTTIPKEHSWIRNCYFNNMPITGFFEGVKFVDKSNPVGINDKVTPQTTYARFTNHWLLSGVNSGDAYVVNNQKLLGKDDVIVGNLTLNPIYKPWAAVHLCVNPDNANLPYYYLVKKLSGTNFQSSYYTQITISAKDSFNTVNKKINEYVRTLSPVRIEQFLCNGARVEYDKFNLKRDGSCWLKISQEKCIHAKYLQDIHKAVDMIKQNCIQQQIDTNYIMLIASSYGQGIRTQHGLVKNVRRPIPYFSGDGEDDRLQNLCILSDANPFIRGVRATNDIHIGQFLMNMFLKNGVSYRKLVSNINKSVAIASDIAFLTIKNLYNDIYDDAVQYLRDEQDDTWSPKKQWEYEHEFIVDDITKSFWSLSDGYEMGKTYFCQDDYDKNSDNSAASDNYFDDDTRKYRINGGFIGYIKNKLAPGLIKNKSDMASLWKYPSNEEQLKEYEDAALAQLSTDIAEVSKNMEEKPTEPQPPSKDASLLTWLAYNDECEQYRQKYAEWLNKRSNAEKELTDKYNQDIKEKKEQVKWIENLDKKVDKVIQQISDKLSEKFNGDKCLCRYVPFVKPRAYCTGNLNDGDAVFFKNPNSNVDRWLTSDSDLTTLTTMCKKHSLFEIMNGKESDEDDDEN